ncbi:MAG: hypothetical protein AAF591_07270 [Verrucomicrobiota bacterium]
MKTRTNIVSLTHVAIFAVGLMSFSPSAFAGDKAKAKPSAEAKETTKEKAKPEVTKSRPSAPAESTKKPANAPTKGKGAGSASDGLDKEGMPALQVDTRFYEIKLRLKNGNPQFEWDTNDPSFMGVVYLYESADKLDGNMISGSGQWVYGKKKVWTKDIELTPGMQARVVALTLLQNDVKKYISIRRTQPFPDITTSSPK